MIKIKTLVFLSLTIFISNNFQAQKPIDSLLVKLDSILEVKNIPGAMISIVNSDSIIFAGGIGYANLEKKEAVTSDHLFRLGSISKSFTAIGLVKLLAEKQLSLSSPIAEIDPTLDLKNSWKATAPITIEQILEHTAGFDDMHNHASYNTTDTETPSCLAMVKVHKKSLYARWQPGTRMAYSNPGYVLAGHLMEQISQQPYYQYLKDNLLIPLGMSESGFFFKQPSDRLMAEGYVREGNQFSTTDFKSVNGGPASDLCSNAKEMSLFLMFLLSKKIPQTPASLIDEKWFDRIENPATTLAAKNGFIGGYGLGNMTVWANNYLFHGHDGGIDGFSSMYLYSREANFGLAISINKQGGLWTLIDEILNFYLGPNQIQNTKYQPIPEKTRNKFSGFYNFKSPRNQTMYFIQKMMTGHSITFEDNYLLVKDFGDVVRDTLYHKGNNQFYRKTEGLPFVMLLEDENKKAILWLGNDYAEKENKTIRVLKNYVLLGSVMMSVLGFFVGFGWWIKRFFTKEKVSTNSRLILWLPSFFFILMIISFVATAYPSVQPHLA